MSEWENVMESSENQEKKLGLVVKTSHGRVI